MYGGGGGGCSLLSGMILGVLSSLAVQYVIAEFPGQTHFLFLVMRPI